MLLQQRSSLRQLLLQRCDFLLLSTQRTGSANTGFVELFYAAYDDDALDDEGGIYGDFDLSFRPSGGSLGFDVGAFASQSDEGGNGIFYWAGTWYTPNGGKVSLGYGTVKRKNGGDSQ